MKSALVSSRPSCSTSKIVRIFRALLLILIFIFLYKKIYKILWILVLPLRRHFFGIDFLLSLNNSNRNQSNASESRMVQHSTMNFHMIMITLSRALSRAHTVALFQNLIQDLSMNFLYETVPDASDDPAKVQHGEQQSASVLRPSRICADT